MSDAIVTPPAAPAAAPTPAPAPSPAPSPSPSPSPSPEPSQADPNPFSEVWKSADAKRESMDGPKVEPKTQEPPKTPAKAPERPQETPKGAKAPEKPKSEPHKLRDEVDARKAELAARTSELETFKESHAKLEAKVRELETKGQDSSKVLARIGQLEKDYQDKVKENEELSGRLRILRLEDDPQFKKDYDDKFNKQAALAQELVEKLDVLGEVSRDENGQPVVGPVGKANWHRDFVKLYHQYKDSPAVAYKAMKQMFGDEAAALVLPEVQGLVRMERERNEKLNESRAKAKEMREQEEAQVVTRRQQLQQLQSQVNKDLEENNPEFRIDPTDQELAQVRGEVLRIFDGKPADDKQAVVKKAFVRQMVGQSAVQKIMLTRITKERDALRAELDSLKNPVPPPSARPSSGAAKEDETEDWGTRAKRELSGV